MIMEDPPPTFVESGSLPQYNVSAPTTSDHDQASGAQTLPAYALQSNFRIDNKITPRPLVSPSQLQTHLNLLRVFKELKTKLQKHPLNIPEIALKLTPEKRWVWFLELAVERFRRWVENLLAESVEDIIAREVPPIDVWLVWHAYMLNPVWYAEDCERLPILRGLNKLRTHGDLPLEILSKIGDLSTYEPSESQVNRWLEATNIPFDPVLSANVLIEKSLQCPNCNQSTSAPFLAYNNRREVGYAQQDFESVCTKCQSRITKEKLAVAKFARDITRDPKNLDDVAMYSYGVYLPGTVHSPTNAKDTRRAKMIKNMVMRSSVFKSSQHTRTSVVYKLDATRQDTRTEARELEIKNRVKYSMDKIRTHLSKQMRAPLVRKVLSAYNDDRPFSIDLVGAVVRQGSFVDKMHDLGWTQPGFFSSKEDEIVLHHCVARYHAFLDLISSSSTAFFVPTLDIDLAWHTHQLCPNQYADDCTTYIKRFVNHDDKVEETHLSTSFDVTCRAWQQRFGVAYMHCGCPLPGETIGQKLSKLKINILNQKNPINPPDRDDCFLATHPSDHNSIFIYSVSHEQRQKRMKKIQSYWIRDAKKIQEGKLDERVYRKGERHDPGFLVPVPLYYSVGYIGYPGACAAGVRGCGGGSGGGGGGGSRAGGGSNRAGGGSNRAGGGSSRAGGGRRGKGGCGGGGGGGCGGGASC